MGFFLNVLKVTAKAGLVGGTVYITIDQGVWKDSKESLNIIERAKKEAAVIDAYIPGFSGYIEKLNKEKGIVFSIPAHKPIPEHWNDGVFATFKFLDQLPQHLSHYANVAKDKVTELIK